MKLSKSVLCLTSTMLLLPAGAQAESWSCRQSNDVREVHIERTTDAAVPCDVVYRKLTEGEEDRVLWSAQHDENYCDTQAAGFIEKLEGWGWTCVETIRDESTAQ